MTALLVGISLDPQGIYVGHDAACNLFWYSVPKGIWIYLDPHKQGTDFLR